MSLPKTKLSILLVTYPLSLIYLNIMHNLAPTCVYSAYF